MFQNIFFIIKLIKNTYEVSYIINGKLYKMIVTPVRGPTPILSITNEHDNNIIDEIIPYFANLVSLNCSNVYARLYSFTYYNILI